MRNKWSGKELLGCVVLLALMLFLAMPVLVLPDSGFAKMYEEPRSFSLKDESLEKVERKVLPEIDIKRLLDEDRERGKDPKHPGPLALRRCLGCCLYSRQLRRPEDPG